MPGCEDLLELVHGHPIKKHLPVIWNFVPGYDGMIGGIPNLSRYFFDVDEKLFFQKKLKNLFPDALVFPGYFPDFGVTVEVSAFGGRLQWSKNQAPYCHPALGGLSEVDSLKPLQPGETGLTAAVLVQKELMRRKLKSEGIELERVCFVMGPAEVAGLIVGYEKYYMGIYEDPARILKLTEIAAEFLIKWIAVQGEIAGGNDVVIIADHVGSQVRPAHFNEFIFPYLKAVFDESPKAVKVYHNEGFHTNEHIDLVLKLGADVWHYGSDVYEIDELLKKVDRRIIPFGGLNPHGLIRTGRPEEVRSEARKTAEKALGFKMLCSTGTGTTPDAPLANVRAMVEGFIEAGG